MRGGASWLGFLIIPLAIILLIYAFKYMAKKFRKRASLSE